MDPIVTRVSGRPLAAGAPRRVRDRSSPEGVAIEPGLALRVQWSQELSRMGMRWRSTHPGRPACQIVCRRPTPQLGQRPSPMTAAGGTAGDEANEAVSTDTRRAKPRPSGCRYLSGTAMPTWPPEKESSLISMLDEDCWLRKIPSISDVPLSIGVVRSTPKRLVEPRLAREAVKKSAASPRCPRNDELTPIVFATVRSPLPFPFPATAPCRRGRSTAS